VKNVITDPPAAEVRQAEDLAQLAAQINRERESGDRAAKKSLEHYMKCGEMLLRAKKACGHGNFLDWMKANVKFSQQRCSEYMRLYTYRDKVPVTGTLTSALEVLTKAHVQELASKLPHVPPDQPPKAAKVAFRVLSEPSDEPLRGTVAEKSETTHFGPAKVVGGDGDGSSPEGTPPRSRTREETIRDALEGLQAKFGRQEAVRYLGGVAKTLKDAIKELKPLEADGWRQILGESPKAAARLADACDALALLLRQAEAGVSGEPEAPPKKKGK
jgi:hypothetical protein